MREWTKEENQEALIEFMKKRIRGLNEEIEGYQEALRANEAIITAMLYGDDCDGKDCPFRVDKKIVAEAVQGRYLAIVTVKEEDPNGYYLHYEKAEEGATK